ncbi:MAG: tRNA nucleotidyltransferase, partial [Duncaniella sp.]|nr:tRNA nucleotidyltransferase [Duncaniella sp.]
RRLINDAGDDLEDLLMLCEADITSKNREKVKRLLGNLSLVRMKIADLNARDEIRHLQPPVDGNEIMEIFNIPGGPLVGTIKSALKNAILDGEIAPGDREGALQLMYRIAAEHGLQPVQR